MSSILSKQKSIRFVLFLLALTLGLFFMVEKALSNEDASIEDGFMGIAWGTRYSEESVKRLPTLKRSYASDMPKGVVVFEAGKEGIVVDGDGKEKLETSAPFRLYFCATKFAGVDIYIKNVNSKTLQKVAAMYGIKGGQSREDGDVYTAVQKMRDGMTVRVRIFNIPLWDSIQ